MNDPMAPISHHWQDATHISFGVLTAGVFTHSLRLEGSIFNGREPDENRTNFDYSGRSLDSYAGRLSWNPSPRWSLTGSYAYLKSPEGLKPDESVHRVNASIMNGRTFGTGGELATTFVYGANKHPNSTALESSYLLESNLEFGGAHSMFGRAEYVQKGAEDLVLGTGGPTGEFNITSLVNLGVEYYGGLGPIKAFDARADQSHQLFGVVNLGFAEDWEFNAGVGFGLTDASEKRMVKLILGHRVGTAPEKAKK